MANINKIFAKMAKMSISSAYPHESDKINDRIDNIRFEYTDITKVVAITAEHIKEYYMTLFNDAMEVIHEVVDKQACADCVFVSTTDTIDDEQCLDKEYSGPCGVFDMHPSDSPSYYYGH